MKRLYNNSVKLLQTYKIRKHSINYFNNIDQHAFTLIELLLVITIISILAGILISIINPNSYLQPSRDSQRIKNILELQTAITGAVTTNKIKLIDTSTCTSCTSTTGTNAVDGTGWIKFTNISGRGLQDYMQNLPKDPVNDSNLQYSYYSDGQNFEINATLESEKYASNAVEDGGNDDLIYERGWDLNLN